MRTIFALLTTFGLLVDAIVFAQEPGLRAGAAMSNITPKMGVPLDGTIMQIGPAKHVHDELWVRCLVLDDGKTKLAFAEVDNTMVSREIHDEAKTMIEQRVGIRADHVCIAATHTHSTPRALVGLKDDDLHREYLDDLAVKIADGVVRAFNELSPAEIGWNSFREPRYVHNRRWRMKKTFSSPFGNANETVKMNPGRLDPNLDEPAGPVDDEVFVVAIRHRGNHQPLALMANYGLHYVGGVPGGQVSADYFGVFADRLQQKWDADRLSPPFVAMMTNGTSGDVNANDFTKPRAKLAPFERMTQIANDVATGTMAVLPNLEYRTDVALDAAAEELKLGVRKPDETRLAWAHQNRVPDDIRQRLSRPQIYAREASELSKFPDTVSVRLQVFRIGNLAIAQSPCETFAATGLKIKSASPFKGNTFTIELANGYSGYLPPEDQFELGGYETWPARSSYLEIGAESKIRNGLVDLLKQLKPLARDGDLSDSDSDRSSTRAPLRKPLARDGESSDSNPEGWTSLLSGKNLAGWHRQKERGQHGSGGHWGMIAGGVLFGEQDPPGSGNGGLLLTDETYSEFELELSLHPDWGPDSGVFVRTDERGGGWQIYVDHHDNGNVGHIRLETKPYSVPFRPWGFSRIDAAKPDLKMAVDARTKNWPAGVYEHSCTQEQWLRVWKNDDWNRLRVRVTGEELPVIETWINEMMVCRFNATTTTHPKCDRERAKSVTNRTGSIGLQVHGGKNWKEGDRVLWKEIRVRKIKR